MKAKTKAQAAESLLRQIVEDAYPLHLANPNWLVDARLIRMAAGLLGVKMKKFT